LRVNYVWAVDWIENLLAEQAQFYDQPSEQVMGVCRYLLLMNMISIDFREKFLPFFGAFFFGINIRVEEVAS
jgi:hypothetical protein